MGINVASSFKVMDAKHDVGPEKGKSVAEATENAEGEESILRDCMITEFLSGLRILDDQPINLDWRFFMKIQSAAKNARIRVVLATLLVLFFLSHVFAGNLEYGVRTWEVPSGQPDQMWSKIDYDPKLIDPFFESNKWSYPWYIIKHPNGNFEDTSSGKSSKKEPPRLKHTANCFSDAYGAKHLLRFCEARLLDSNMIDLLIHEGSASYCDALKIQIRNETFSCQYWALYQGGGRGEPGTIWTTKQQKLTLDKKTYRKGDVIKGRIDIECVEEATNSEYIEKWGRNPKTIRISGVFKTTVE